MDVKISNVKDQKTGESDMDRLKEIAQLRGVKLADVVLLCVHVGAGRELTLARYEARKKAGKVGQPKKGAKKAAKKADKSKGKTKPKSAKAQPKKPAKKAAKKAAKPKPKLKPTAEALDAAAE